MGRNLMVDATVSTTGTRVNRRLTFVRWVRRTHGWFGLWGALLGLIFGASGIWLNHRAVLKLQLPAQRMLNAELALPDSRFETPQAMASWLQQALKLDRPAINTRIERARPVPWAAKGADKTAAGEAGQRPLMQPERWNFAFGGPNRIIQVEYWAGNKSVSVRTIENGFFATLTNLHKGVGMPIPWILLVDTLAGSLLFLSVSGLILWWETNRRRRLGIAIFGVSVIATLGLALWPLQS
ncbi:MAG: PepSY-associated TM helix domain-containing protein [Proteobacteria bacterium]|nr:PepSY-associated TM helix domain-containing protein [Pseudomonadota bacterium]